jgi:uncharacterized membrane protein (DUF4010 family)
MATTAYLPLDQLVGLLVTLALTFVIGLEREEKGASDQSYMVAGVRTFPIIGALGYVLGRLAPGEVLHISLGFVALSAFLVVSYLHKLRSGDHGATTEMSALIAYLVGVLVAREHEGLAAAVTVAVVLLLQAKGPLERFAAKLPAREITAFVQFLLLTAVILPILPNQDYTQFHLNPFRTWLIVVAVCGVSYVSYLLQRLARTQHSVLLTAVLGGAYSSTATTVVLARRSREAPDLRTYAGAIVLASGVMYARLAVLVWLFNADLGWRLGPRLLVLAVVGAVSGFVIAFRRSQPGPPAEPGHLAERNPLELATAVLFAALFMAMMVVTRLVATYLGTRGLYGLAGVMGLVDVDPFVLSITQSAGGVTPLAPAAAAILVAAASNNLMKGVYALVLGDRPTGRAVLIGLAALGALSLLATIRL